MLLTLSLKAEKSEKKNPRLKCKVSILSSVKIGQHLESVTILEYAITRVQMSMTSFSMQTASRNR
jgi:hypothetical protein